MLCPSLWTVLGQGTQTHRREGQELGLGAGMKGAKCVQCAGGPRPDSPRRPHPPDPLCSLAFSRLCARVEAVMPSIPSSCRVARERLVPRVSGRMGKGWGAGAPGPSSLGWRAGPRSLHPRLSSSPSLPAPGASASPGGSPHPARSSSPFPKLSRVFCSLPGREPSGCVTLCFSRRSCGGSGVGDHRFTAASSVASEFPSSYHVHDIVHVS